MASKVKVGSAWLPVAVLVALTLWTPVPVSAQQGDRVWSVCAECHTVAVSRQFEPAHGKDVNCLSCHMTHSKAPPADAVCASCHEQLTPTHRGVTEGAPACGSCHRIHERATPGAAGRTSARCRTCHEATHALHATTTNPPECTACHSAHATPPLRAADPAVSARCVSCHAAPHPSHPTNGERAPSCTSCHTLGTDTATLKGAQLAATCTGCHQVGTSGHAGVTEGRPQCTDCHSFAKDPPVKEADPAISRRCGACHEQELKGYLKGGHAKGLTDRDLPTCATCHGEHSGQQTRTAATLKCMQCHSSERLAKKYNLPENVGASYADDFHGTTIQLLGNDPASDNGTAVLVCADCHDAHAVGWNKSTQLSTVCLRCHEKGDPALAGAWLGHARVGLHNKPLIWAVRLFYFFTIPFVLIGLALNILFHLRDQRRRGARMRHSEGLHRLIARLRGKKLSPIPTVTRFNRTERIEHFGSMSTFILLLLTGLPQTRPELGIANSIISMFGGIGNTRLIHRTIGVIFVLLLVVHATRAVFAAFTTRRLPVMAPRRQDFVDTLATLRHFIEGTPRPKVGKFDFSEKFEYWGLFLGGTLMTVTGVVLLFPEAVTRLIPGQLLAMFRVMHGLEATFAVSVVVLWHSYGVILRPEVFPLDTTIFTGKMSVERLKEEHELEYERLFPDLAEEEPVEASKTADTPSEEGAVV